MVLVAGVTSFWRGDALLRAASFAIGALVACLLAHAHSAWLIVSLVAVSALSTVFAQFPRPATGCVPCPSPSHQDRPMIEKKSIAELLSTVKYLPNRTPESGFNGETAGVFALASPYRDGAIYVGHYSGSSEWERHDKGDEIVFALEGFTTVVLLVDGAEQRVPLQGGEFVVVPQGLWHRFDGSRSLKVMSVTPTPTDHSLDTPAT